MSNRIMMVDDHPVVRAGLRALLEADEGIEVIAEVGTGDEALRVLDELAASSPGLPDLVLMDLNLGTGSAASRPRAPCASAIQACRCSR